MENRIITTLGKSNKAFLRTEFGFKTITQAKLAFGVDTADEAYELMKNQHNQIVEEEQINKAKQLRAEKEAKKLQVKAERKAKKLEDNKKFITTFTLEINFVRKDNKNLPLIQKLKNKNKKIVIQTKSINGSVVSKKKDIKKYIDEYINYTIVNFEKSDLEVKSTKVSNIVSIEVGKSIGLSNIPMKDAYSYELSGEKKPVWDTGSGKCVFDYLIYLYGDVKGFKKIMNYEFLENEFGYETIEKGVTINQIALFCKTYGISYYALDCYENTISYVVANEKKSNVQALMFRIMNSHMYPITNIHKRKSIVGRHREVIIKSMDVEAKKKEEEIEILDLIYPKEDEKTGNEFAIDYINKCNKIPYPISSKNIFYEDGHITKMKIDNKIILTNPIDETIKKFIEGNGDKYQGECLNNILQNIWTETYNTKMYESEIMSEYNNEVYKILSSDGIKNRVHYGATRQIEKYELENIIACDIEKCYSSLLLKPLDDFIVYDLLDEVKEFTDTEYYTNDMELPLGLYHVRTNNMTILHQSNIYSNKILDYAKKNGVKFTIEHQILSTKKEDKTYFHKLIEDIIFECEYALSDKVDCMTLIKQLINSITGCLGKTHSKHLQVGLNSNLQEVWENEIMRNVDKKDIYFNKLDDKLFVYGEIKKSEMTNNSLPIYIQILDWSNIKLHEMIKEMGGECIFRKTDCAVVIGGNPVIEIEKDEDDITKTWGSFRNEDSDFIKHFNYEKRMSVDRHIDRIYITQDWITYNTFNSSNQWKEILQLAIKNKGLLVEGRAGTGKSYIVLNGIKHELIADEKECRLAFTNKASQNLNGTTIHKALAINANEKSNNKSLQKYINKKIIIVDEIGMINKLLWKHLCILKKKFPDLIFILLGDYRQCKPIEDFDFNYFDSSIVKYLVNYNKIELTEKQRYDDELWEFLENYYEKGIVGKLQHTNKINPDKKMICYFNKTRDEINDYCMNKRKPADSLYIEHERQDEKDKAKSVYIYNGLPIMAIKNNSKLDIINTDEFIVKDFNNESITLKRLSQTADDLIIESKYFHNNFVVNYISTTHKLQGATVTDDLIIFDWYGKPYFNNSLRDDKHVGYTALSRVKSLKQIYIYQK